MELPPGLIEALPYYDLVPKDLAANLEARAKLREACIGNPELQAAVMQACSEDILFYVNMFCWTYNPKDYPDRPNRPFITWSKQDDILVGLEWAVNNRRDVALPKSRQLGCTWICALFFEWRWHFRNRQSFIVTSRTEEYIDERGSPKELFYKFDYLHEHQPQWMLPPGRHLGRKDVNRPKNMMVNCLNRSIIAGTSTTPDLGRGDTLTALLNDEAASQDNAKQISAATRNATHTRIWNSTPKGRSGKGREFYLQAHNSANLIIRVHWSDHPEKDELAYRIERSRPIAVRANQQDAVDVYWAESKPLIDELRKRGFAMEGKRRSPYYDLQCSRSSDETEIAQEEDINFLVEGRSLFDESLLDRLRELTVEGPWKQGLLDVDSETLDPEWIHQRDGPWKLWVELDGLGSPWRDMEYFVGVDIASGLGGTSHSNSSIQVINSLGVQMASFASNTVRPDQLAKLAIATCKWFTGASGLGAVLNWETNGGFGADFTQCVKESGYTRIYYRETGKEFTTKKTRVPGWGSSKETKPVLFGSMHKALGKGDLVIRDIEVIDEFGEYIVDRGLVVHSSAKTTDDDAAMNEAHGDRAIAMGVAWITLGTVPKSKRVVIKQISQHGSFAHRREERKRLTEAADKW